MIEILNATGKPYSFKNYNCWHHVKHIRDCGGLKTKDYYAKTLSEAYKLIQSNGDGDGLKKIVTPENLSIVIGRYHEGHHYHCGVYYDGYVSHCCRTARQVVVDTYSEFVKKFNRVDLWL